MRPLPLPPQVLLAVAALAAAGAVLAARPAAGGEASTTAVPARAVEPAPEAARPPATEPRETSLLVRSQETGAPPARQRPRGTLVLRPAAGAPVLVRARPRGPVVARLGGRTELGSPTTLAVAARRGDWYGVVTTHVPNGKLGWVSPAESRVVASRTRVRITVDLSARRLVVRRGKEVLRRITVAVGRPGSPTPVGRFAVTDKVPGSRFGPYYGCCILALSAHQPNLPPGWTGGDRIAVHGTNNPGSIGQAVSAGCPRASDGDLRFLLRTVPLGAPVVIRR